MNSLSFFKLKNCFFFNLLFLAIKEYQSGRIELNLTRDSAGQYRCTASNSNGKDEKTIFVHYFGK